MLCVMATIEGPAGFARGVHRKLITLPASEIEPGDVVRDEGMFKQVERVEPQVAAKSLSLRFMQLGGTSAMTMVNRTLTVGLFQDVSVWRVCGER
jgi:hypothetical protein